MLKITITFKRNEDKLLYITKNRAHAMKFRNNFLNQKGVKEIKTEFFIEDVNKNVKK